MKRSLVFGILIFLAGVVVGAVFISLIFGNSRDRSLRIYAEQMLSHEENEAVSKFNEGSHLVTLYAQDRLISSAGHYREAGVLDEENYFRIRAMAEARKAMLYEKTGELDKSKALFADAIEMLKKAQINTDVDGLKTVLLKRK